MNQTVSDTLPSVDQMTDILDIEPILPAPYRYLFDHGGTILIVLLAIALMIWLLKRPRKVKPTNPEEMLSPWDKALLEIKKLEQQKLLEKGDYRKFYFFISEIFRRYLDERFHYPAIDKTTSEISRELTGLSFAKQDEGRINNFLSQGDQIKFANASSTINQAKEDSEWLVSFIQKSIPQVDEKK